MDTTTLPPNTAGVDVGTQLDRPLRVGRDPAALHLSAADLGRLGEDIAAAYLVRSGMHLLDRNVRLGRGEIDAVALDDGTLVIVEVKTRRTVVTGVPQESVTAAKLRTLRALTGRYLAEHSPPHRDLRIDVIAVLIEPDGTIALEHLRGVQS